MHPLVKRRLDLGMTRADLSDKSGVSWGTIRRIEVEEKPANEDTIIKLARALGISASSLTQELEPPVAA